MPAPAPAAPAAPPRDRPCPPSPEQGLVLGRRRDRGDRARGLDGDLDVQHVRELRKHRARPVGALLAPLHRRAAGIAAAIGGITWSRRTITSGASSTTRWSARDSYERTATTPSSTASRRHAASAARHAAACPAAASPSASLHPLVAPAAEPALVRRRGRDRRDLRRALGRAVHQPLLGARRRPHRPTDRARRARRGDRAARGRGRPHHLPPGPRLGAPVGPGAPDPQCTVTSDTGAQVEVGDTFEWTLKRSGDRYEAIAGLQRRRQRRVPGVVPDAQRGGRARAGGDRREHRVLGPAQEGRDRPGPVLRRPPRRGRRSRSSPPSCATATRRSSSARRSSRAPPGPRSN